VMADDRAADRVFDSVTKTLQKTLGTVHRRFAVNLAVNEMHADIGTTTVHSANYAG
jgi:hypothetical protein